MPDSEAPSSCLNLGDVKIQGLQARAGSGCTYLLTNPPYPESSGPLCPSSRYLDPGSAAGMSSWASCRQWDCDQGRGGGCASQTSGWSVGSRRQAEDWGARGPHVKTEEGESSAR